MHLVLKHNKGIEVVNIIKDLDVNQLLNICHGEILLKSSI